jgi:sugar transferase (PEP-CTERM/EpsH1 system associated)
MVTRAETIAAGHRPVRVMHVVFALQPGGMEHGVVKLVNGLDPSRVRSAICSTRPAGVLKALVAPHVPLFEMNRRNGNDVRLVWELYRLFRRERPDVVHTHAWGTLIEGLIAARLARVPSVVHGEHGTLQLRPHQRWLQRWAWCRADQTLSVSSRLAERMAAETGLSADRVLTIRNGVDLARFSPTNRAAARASLGLGRDECVIGTVGRLVPVKDHTTLLEAVALLRGKGARVTLLIAGDGPLGHELVERAAGLGLDGRVRFLGHRRDVDVVLAGLDVFVLSSVSEGLSNTILEAMATGVPVVATRVGGADELVVDGVSGMLVAPSAPLEMADALSRLLADPRTRREMGAAGRARAEKEFALRAMVSRYEALYTRVGRRSAPGAAPADTNVEFDDAFEV